MYLYVVYLILDGASVADPAVPSPWVVANKIVKAHSVIFSFFNKFSINKQSYLMALKNLILIKNDRFFKALK